MSDLESENLDYDTYIGARFAEEDDVLRAAREEMQKGGLPQIAVSASQGKLLHVLALIHRPARILEIGTLGGYSGIWLARALAPGGKMVTLEIDPHHADVARKNFERAGLADTVEVRVGPALDSLAAMADAGEAPFDLVFIDADKDGYPAYLEKAVPLTREGGLILADNVLRADILSPTSDSSIARFNAAAAAHPALVSVVFPVLRSRGLDGLLVAVKRTAGAA